MIFRRALNLLPELEETNTTHARFLNDMRMEKGQFPDLHEEVFAANS